MKMKKNVKLLFLIWQHYPDAEIEIRNVLILTNLVIYLDIFWHLDTWLIA